MTDKQIIIDGKIKPITLEDVPTILELHKSKSFVEIAKMYGVTQNAIRYWVKKYNVKPLKQKDQIKILEEQLKRAEKTMQEIWDRLGKTSDELLRKEQECEELRKANDEKNELLAKLGCPTTATAKRKVFCLQEQLDQLKAENDELKKTVDDFLHKPEVQDKILWKIDNEALLGSKDAYIYKLEKTLTEIKEIAENAKTKVFVDMEEFWEQILQKISECEGNDVRS